MVKPVKSWPEPKKREAAADPLAPLVEVAKTLRESQEKAATTRTPLDAFLSLSWWGTPPHERADDELHVKLQMFQDHLNEIQERVRYISRGWKCR